MLKLPSKRWKRARFRAEGEGTYTLSFISQMNDEQEFKEIVEEDIGACLNEGDRVIALHRDTRTVTLEISDCEVFRRRLALVNIVIEE